MGRFRLLAGVAALAAVLTDPAFAQWNNEPYQFRNSGGSLGMSPAYRQGILNEELFKQRPENLVRGADGRLLTVIERHQQAYLAEPEPNFAVPQPGMSVVGGSGMFLSTGAIGGWTAMVEGTAPTYAPPRPAPTPIDAWIRQLD